MAEDEVDNVVVDVALEILVVDEVDLVGAVEVDAVVPDQLIMILLLAIGAGCMAILLVTIPKPVMHNCKGSGNAGPSQGRFSQSAQKGPKPRGRGRSVCFSTLSVLYNDEGNTYPVDDARQLYVPLEVAQGVDESAEAEIQKDTKK